VSLSRISQLTAEATSDGAELSSATTSGDGAGTEIEKQRGQPFNGSELLDALMQTTNTRPAKDGNGENWSTR
jgi:hypothetical protein